MFCCCCWPLHKCVTVLSLLDTVIIAFFAFNAFEELAQTIDDPHWITIVSFVVLTAILICQILASICTVQAHKRSFAHYLLPRLALCGMLVILSTLGCIFVLYYFMSGEEKMNKMVFQLHDYFYPGELDDFEKGRMVSDLKIYAGVFGLLSCVYALYNGFALMLTKKYYEHLNGFRPLPQEASAPACNPDYPPPHHKQDASKGATYPSLP
ncbi:unnamed protein product, partial [Mesorhabditis spiculigera]